MADRFPSISPDGTRIAASTLPRGGQPVQYVGPVIGEWVPTPVEYDASGGVWRDNTELLFVRNKPGDRQDGAIMLLDHGGVSEYRGPGLEGWSCHNGHFAGWHRDDRLKSITVSRDGHVAGTVDRGGSVDLVVDHGPIAEPRYTGEALVWVQWVDGVRRIFGRRSHGAPTEHLSWPFPDDEFWPLAIETPLGLYLLTHGHPEKGRPLWLRPWAVGQTYGHVVAHGLADRPDARTLERGMVLVAFSNLVSLQRVHVNLATPLQDVRGSIVVPDPPRPDPPKEPDVSVRDVPNLKHVIERCKHDFPVAWRNCHRATVSRDQAEEFARRAAYACWLEDRRFGLNGKRGDANTISQDCVCFLHDDGRESVIDFGGGAGGDHPTVQWSIVGHYLPPGPPLQLWIRPELVGGQQPTPNPTPTPTPQPSFTFPTGTEAPEDVVLSLIDLYLAGLRERDKVRAQDVVPSRGALMYLFAVFFRELSSWIVEKKRAPQGMEWWGVRDRIVAAAVKHYQDRQGVD
jgi:hypothetical protein